MKKTTFLVTIIIANIVILSINEVNLNKAKSEDLDLYLSRKEQKSLRNKLEFSNQIKSIRKIQSIVLTKAPSHISIPKGRERNLKALYQSESGQCFDRSRVIEIILRTLGYNTRHIFMFSIKKTKSKLKSLLTKQVPSHALTEVKTKKGWLVIDSNADWISLDSKGKPISIKQIQEGIFNKNIISFKNTTPSFIYNEPFGFIYGLYSRHGEFYPPYNFIPDINYSELIQNF